MTKMQIGGSRHWPPLLARSAQYVGTKLGHAVVAVHGPGALKRLSWLGSSMIGENEPASNWHGSFQSAGRNFSIIQTLLS